MQLLFNGYVSRVQLRLLLYMKQRIHEALLIGCLVRAVWDYGGLWARLLLLAAEGDLLHGSNLLLLKIYGRHLGRGMLRQTRPLVRMVVELGVATVFLLRAAPIPVLALLRGTFWAPALLRI